MRWLGRPTRVFSPGRPLHAACHSDDTMAAYSQLALPPEAPHVLLHNTAWCPTHGGSRTAPDTLTGLPNTLRVGKLCSPSPTLHTHASRSPAGQHSKRGHLTVVRNGTVLIPLHMFSQTWVPCSSTGGEMPSCHSASLKPKKVPTALKAKSPVLQPGFELSLCPTLCLSRGEQLSCGIKAYSKQILGRLCSTPA